MSLKAFHVVFITAASALCFGCGVWAFRNYFSPNGRLFDLLFALGSVLAAIALIVYERYFLKKLKHVDYL
jgi:lysozyme family protein